MNVKAQREPEKGQRRLQAELFEADGQSLGSYVTEGEDRLIIGSSKRADLVVPHGNVSHIHAMLRIVDEKNILLYDLGSEQGTFVAGQKIIERRLNPGEVFQIGGHRVKVNLLDQSVSDERGGERALFWQVGNPGQPDLLEMVRIEAGIVRGERTLSRNGQVLVGRRKNEVLIEGIKGGERFLLRKDEGNRHCVECILPKNFVAEIYDDRNELIRVIEQAETKFTFRAGEKARLLSPELNSEVLLFWRPQGIRASRRNRDADSPALQRSMLLCGCIAALVLLFVSYVPLKKEALEEATIPKSSYLRLTMDSAPASSESAEAQQPAAPNAAPTSKAESISSSLSKILNKKSSVTAESIQQAISQNGNVSTRVSNLKTGGLKSEEIAAGSVGGAVNVNALSAGLSSGGGGKAGALKGFANGKGTAIGGSGFGKGFDMSLGGDEAEAIGGLDKSLIDAVVQANIGQIKHCYERQLIVDPNIFGKVVAQWAINKDGGVSTSSVKKTTMNNQSVENCIAARIKGWAFPKPLGGGQVIVSYPFLFKSLN